MEELIGKTISKVEMDGDTVIVFTTGEGEKIAYDAYGDCCSSSWFAHITNIEALLGNKVNAVVEREEFSDAEQKQAEAEGKYDCLALYANDIKTDKGTCEIEYRNDSNGYYGGSCDLTSHIEKNLKEITKDF